LRAHQSTSRTPPTRAPAGRTRLSSGLDPPQHLDRRSIKLCGEEWSWCLVE
jgi:hypothetical protein